MKLLWTSAVFDGERIWLVEKETGRVYVKHINTGSQIKNIGRLNDAIINDLWCIDNIYAIEGRVFFVSFLAYEIWEYDVKSNRFTHKCLSDKTLQDGCVSVLVDGVIWIMPRNFKDDILRYDVSSGKCSVVSIDMVQYAELRGDTITPAVYYDGGVFFAGRKIGEITLFRIDVGTGLISKYALKKFETVTCCAIDDEGVFVFGRLLNGKSAIVKYDEKTKKYDNYLINSIYYPENNNTFPYRTVVPFRGTKIYIPCHLKNIEVGYDNGEKARIEWPEDIKKMLLNDCLATATFFIYENDLYLISGNYPNMIKIDVNNERVEVIELDIEEYDERGYYKEVFGKGIRNENEIYSFREFIKYAE